MENPSPQKPFYLTNDVKLIAYRNSSFYCLYSDKLYILHELDGKMTKSISIKGNSITFDSKGNILVLAPSSSKIFIYYLDGEKGFVTQKPSRAHKKRAKHRKIKTQRGGVSSIYIFVCFAHFSSTQKNMKLKFHIFFNILKKLIKYYL